MLERDAAVRAPEVTDVGILSPLKSSTRELASTRRPLVATLGQFLGRSLPSLLLLATVITVAVIRLNHLGSWPLNRDEAASWYLARLPLPALWSQSSHETFPPLYPVLLKGWMIPFGDSAAALRSFSIMTWLATVGLTFGFARQALGRSPALLAALIVTLSPTLMDDSFLVRMYSLETALAICGWWLLWALVSKGTGWRAKQQYLAALGIVLIVAAEVWSMSLGLPIAGLQVLFGFACVAFLRSRSALLASGAALLGAASLLPWLPNLLSVATNGHSFWAATPDAAILAGTAGSWLVGSLGGAWALVGVIAVALAGLGLLHLCRRARRPSDHDEGRNGERGLALPLVLGLAVSLALAVWLYSQVRSIYDARYLSICVPPFAILIAAGAESFVAFVARGRLQTAVRWTTALLLVGVMTMSPAIASATSTNQLLAQRDLDPASQMVDQLQTLVRPGDVVMTLNAQAYFPMAYYFERTGIAQRLGVELYHWHRPTAAFFTGWQDIDPMRVIDLEKVDLLGWYGAIPLAQSGHVWLVTLTDPGYEFPLFVPTQTGSLVVLRSIVIQGNGITGEVWETVPR